MSEPAAFQVYVAGQLQAPLTAPVTPLSRIAASAPTAQAGAAPTPAPRPHGKADGHQGSPRRRPG
ncbi:MAG: hypothetical protein WDM92_11665 [Caulobacteraceae bacterium]